MPVSLHSVKISMQLVLYFKMLLNIGPVFSYLKLFFFFVYSPSLLRCASHEFHSSGCNFCFCLLLSLSSCYSHIKLSLKLWYWKLFCCGIARFKYNTIFSVIYYFILLIFASMVCACPQITLGNWRFANSSRDFAKLVYLLIYFKWLNFTLK